MAATFRALPKKSKAGYENKYNQRCTSIIRIIRTQNVLDIQG